jgi:hypothetical protein
MGVADSDSLRVGYWIDLFDGSIHVTFEAAGIFCALKVPHNVRSEHRENRSQKVANLIQRN